jgi:hypothetical protein
MEETFTFKPKRTQYYNQIGVSTGSTKKNAKTPRKKPHDRGCAMLILPSLS